MSKIKILGCWTSSNSYAAYTNKRDETIVSFHNVSAINILSSVTELFKKDIGIAIEKKKGVKLRPLKDVLGIELGLAFLNISELATELFDGEEVEILIGSTDRYPKDLHIYARMKGSNIKWIDDRSQNGD